MESKNIIKELFNNIINIISNDYSVIFDAEKMSLTITDVSDWDIEILTVEVNDGTICVYWNENDYTFRNANDANDFIHEKILINDFTILADNINISELREILEIVKKLKN